ncbi:MAG: flagellar hook assembly protein FlgD [Chromatiales bacterium]|nr:flagellar hook assembly protein FlgD [Chromatiales bacterium]
MPPTRLGQDQFLELMVAQLKNQDPLKPMQNGEFLSQMAQFGTVSGIQDLQKSFGQMAGALQSNQALLASSLVGRAVLRPGQPRWLLATAARLLGAVELPQARSRCAHRRCSMPAGQVVRQFALGAQSAGTIKFSWDGLSNSGAAMPAGMLHASRRDAVSGGKSRRAVHLCGGARRQRVARRKRRASRSICAGRIDRRTARIVKQSAEP